MMYLTLLKQRREKKKGRRGRREERFSTVTGSLYKEQCREERVSCKGAVIRD
jgi:hypothetical protein